MTAMVFELNKLKGQAFICHGTVQSTASPSAEPVVVSCVAPEPHATTELRPGNHRNSYN